MKIKNIEITYTLEGNRTAKASIGGGWEQWGNTKEVLSEISPVTEALNDVVDEMSEYFDDEENQ